MTIKKRILKYVIENVETNPTLNEICDKLLKEEQEKIMLNPVVYVARTTDKDNNTYLNARCMFPISFTEYRDVKVYVGRFSDFPKGTKDERAKLIGENKMRLHLKKLREHNEI
jgi:hypothetical protein